MKNQPLHMFLLYFHHILLSLSLSQNTHILCACVVSPEGTVCHTRTCLVCVQWRRGPSITQGVKDTLTANQLGARRILCQRLRDGMPVVHTQQIKYVSVCVCARMCVQVCVLLHTSVLFCGREQFVSQKDSAKRNRKGKRVLESRDSAQPLLALTPCSESEKPGELHADTHQCMRP